MASVPATHQVLFPEPGCGAGHQEVRQVVARVGVAHDLEVQKQNLGGVLGAFLVPEEHVVEPRVQVAEGAEGLLGLLHRLPTVIQRDKWLDF